MFIPSDLTGWASLLGFAVVLGLGWILGCGVGGWVWAKLQPKAKA